MTKTTPLNVLTSYENVEDWTGHGPLHTMWGCVVLRHDDITDTYAWVITHQSTDRDVSFEFCQAMIDIWGPDRVAMVAPQR